MCFDGVLRIERERGPRTLGMGGLMVLFFLVTPLCYTHVSISSITEQRKPSMASLEGAF